jgi:DNA-3-methyladenine glycosylase II
MPSISLSLDPPPPFRLDLTVWALRRRSGNAIDRWGGTTYRRVLTIAHDAVEIAVHQTGPVDAPRVHLAASGAGVTQELEPVLAATLTRLLGIDVDLSPFYTFAATDALLAPLAQQFRGLKPPRFPTLFEAVANAIACQQVTLTLGIDMISHLAETYGARAQVADGDAHAFPTPERVATLEPEALRPLSFSRQKARALIELAVAVHEGQLDEDTIAQLDDDAAVGRLRQLHGVGRWSAEYALLRGLGRLHIFPGDDVGARNNLARWLGLSGTLDYGAVQEVLARWKAFGGLIYLHLLLKRLAEAGRVQTE